MRIRRNGKYIRQFGKPTLTGFTDTVKVKKKKNQMFIWLTWITFCLTNINLVEIKCFFPLTYWNMSK